MLAQGVLPFQFQAEERPTGMTALAGLALYLDFFAALGLREAIERLVKGCGGEQGWTDSQLILGLVLLNLVGGESVEDLGLLEGDAGFSALLRQAETHGLSRRGRRALKRRWRGGRKRTVPSSSAAFRSLEAFHDEAQEARREPGRAFIPAPNAHLLGLRRLNADVVGWVQCRASQKQATFDLDATLVESHKRQALPCYQGFRAYQPLNVYWAEQDLVVHSEFRDGNVPAGFDLTRVLQEALAMLPRGVDKVYLRSDSAAYVQELLRYCAEGHNERFGAIEFAIAADVTEAFKDAVANVTAADWQPLPRSEDGKSHPSEQQWAEVCYVPNWAGRSKNGPSYRYLAIREPLAQPDLPGVEAAQLPFPTMTFDQDRRSKLFGLVTNRDLPGAELIAWHRARCGKSERAHAVMKHDLAGGRLPSAKFGANAAWWAIMILAANLNAAFKRLALSEPWHAKRLKAIRLALIHLPARVIRHARGLLIHLSGQHPSFQLLLQARAAILALARPPPA